MKKILYFLLMMFLFETLMSQNIDNSTKGLCSSICKLDSIFSGKVLSTDTLLKISYLPLKFEDFTRTVVFGLKSIRKIEIDWDIAINTLYKNPVYISTNGETSFTYDGKETTYKVSPKSMTITLIADSTIIIKNIKSIYPSQFKFQTTQDSKTLTIILPLKEFEEKIENDNDLALFLLSKTLKIGKTEWKAIFSRIQCE